MIGRKVATGAAMLGALRLVARVLDLIALVILARILTPEDFGLVAIAASILLIANSVTEVPVYDVLVQRPSISDPDLETAFTLTFLRGVGVWLLIVALSWPLASFYTDARLIPILWVVALAPLFQGLASPAMVHFQRDIKFGPHAKAELIGKVAGVCLSLLVAVLTGSYWALVAGMVATHAVTTLCTHIMAPWRPGLRLAGAAAILGFAGWVTLSRILWTINMQADRLLVGRVLGKTSLGHYAMASDIASLATYAVAGPVMRPVFSGYARIKEDIDRLRRAYLKSQQALIMVILPFGIGLAVVAEPLIGLLLGAGWEPVVPVIQWLAPVIALQMMSVPVQALALAVGQPKAVALREAYGIAIRLPATLIAALYGGLIGAAIARALTGLIVIAMNLAIARRLIGLSMRRQFMNGARSYGSAAVMALVLIGLGQGMDRAGWPPAAILAVQIPLGVVTYAAAHLGLWRASGSPEGSERFLFTLLKNRRQSG